MATQRVFGGFGEGLFDGCGVLSLGMGSGGSSEGANFITNLRI